MSSSVVFSAPPVGRGEEAFVRGLVVGSVTASRGALGAVGLMVVVAAGTSLLFVAGFVFGIGV
jgi:hypothetical protein